MFCPIFGSKSKKQQGSSARAQSTKKNDTKPQADDKQDTAKAAVPAGSKVSDPAPAKQPPSNVPLPDSPEDTDFILDALKCSDWFEGMDDDDLDKSFTMAERESEMTRKAVSMLRAAFGKFQGEQLQLFQYILGVCLATLLVKMERSFEQFEYATKVQIAQMANEGQQVKGLGVVGGDLIIAVIRKQELEDQKDADDDKFVDEKPDPKNESPLLVRFVDLSKVNSEEEMEQASQVCELNKFLVEFKLKRTMVTLPGDSVPQRRISRKTIRTALAEMDVKVSETSILSWRWDIQKPATLEEAGKIQSSSIVNYLQSEKRRGVKLVWVDWTCVKQYTGFSIEEIKDLNRLYGVLPPIQSPLTSGSTYIPSNIFQHRHFKAEYSSRAWTAAEHAKMVGNPRNTLDQVISLAPPPRARNKQERRRFLLAQYLNIFLSGLSLPTMNTVEKFLFHEEKLSVGLLLDMLYNSSLRSARSFPEDIARERALGKVLMSTKLRAPFFEDWTEVELVPSQLRHGLNTVLNRRVYALRDAMSAEEKNKQIMFKDIFPWCLAHDEYVQVAQGDDLEKTKRGAVLSIPKELGKTPQQVLDAAVCDKRFLYLLARLCQVAELLVDASDRTIGDLAIFHPQMMSAGSELGIVLDFFLRENPVLGVTDNADLPLVADGMRCIVVPDAYKEVAAKVKLSRSLNPSDLRLENLKYLMTREVIALTEFENIQIVCSPSLLVDLLKWMLAQEIVTAAIASVVYGVFLGIDIRHVENDRRGFDTSFSIALGFPQDAEQVKRAKSPERLTITQSLMEKLEKDSSGAANEFVYREVSKSQGANTTTKLVMPPSTADEAASISIFEREFHCSGITFDGDTLVYGAPEDGIA